MPRKTRRKNNGKNWFETGKPLNWSKDDSMTTRRRAALKSRRGDYLKTARALNALANVTQDKETERKARADAKHFYAMYRKRNKK